MMVSSWLKKLDKRFPASQESEFKQSLQEHFVIPTFVGLLFVIAPLSENLCAEATRPYSTLRLYQTILISTSLSILSCCLMCLILRRWVHWVRSLDLEVLATVVCLVTIAEAGFGCSWHAALIVGNDPIQVYGDRSRATEYQMAFTIAVVSTVACLVVPIRSHIAWVVPKFGLISFCAISFSTSSPFPTERPKLLTGLTSLLVLAGWGGLRSGDYTRDRWLARQEVKQQKDLSEKQRQGFSRILNRLCDCLLHLGPDFHFIEQSSTLSAILFQDPGKMQHCFTDHLATTEDADLFIAAMRQESPEEAPAGILSVHLKDVHSRQVQVHLHYTCFKDEDDTLHYLIGVVEAGERAEIQSPVAALGVRPQGFPSTSRANSGSEDSGSQTSGDEGSHGSNPISLQTVGVDLAEVSVTIGTTSGLQVVSCSPSFTSLCGAIGSDPNFTDWVVENVEKEKLEHFVEDVVTDFAACHMYGELALRIPTSPGIEYLVEKVRMDAITYTGDDLDMEHQFTMRLSFFNIQQRRARRRRDRSRVRRSKNAHVHNVTL